MDKTESYKILSERLLFFSEQEVCLKLIHQEQDFEESILGESGTSYTLSFEQKGNVLFGKIHDNNNANFELLEESIKISS